MLHLATNTDYNTRINPADADYPLGSARNDAGAALGTPYLASRANDIFGLQQALIGFAGITASGSPGHCASQPTATGHNRGRDGAR